MLVKLYKKPDEKWPIKCAYRIEVGLFGGKAGLMLPFRPYGVRGVIGKAGVSGRGDPAKDVSGSVSDRYDENDSSRTCFKQIDSGLNKLAGTTVVWIEILWVHKHQMIHCEVISCFNRFWIT